MISKIQQRLMKEILIRAYREKPETATWPVYFIPFECSDVKDYAKLCRGMHELPHIPWPEEDCIIMAEDPTTQMLGMGQNMIVGLFRDHREFIRYASLPRNEEVGDIEPLAFIAAFLRAGDNTVYTMTKSVIMMRKMFVYWADDFEESHQRYLNRLKSSYPNIDREAEKNLGDLVRYGSPWGLDHFWLAKNWNDKKETYEDQVGFATDVFGYLISLISPCHYVVKTTFKNGFGTSSLKRLTKNKPIFSMIPFHRIYRHIQRPGTGDGEPKTPHPRRGHVRHLWKEAGVDRFKLPESTIERIKLIAEKRVRRIYIASTWVGPRVFNDDQTEYEILPEWELPMLRRF